MPHLLYALDQLAQGIPRDQDLTTSRIAVIGDRGCGKTSFTARWCHGGLPLLKCPDISTVEDIYHRSIYYPALTGSSNYNEYSKLQLHLLSNVVEFCETGLSDSLGDREPIPQSRRNDILDVEVLEGADFEQADYSELATLQINQTDGFMLCFDVTRAESLEYVRLLYRQIWKIRGDDVPIVICAMKSDVFHEEREVELRQVAELCDELQLHMDETFFEVSAFEDYGIHESFYRILGDIEAHKKMLRDQRKLKDDEITQCGLSEKLATFDKAPSFMAPRDDSNQTTKIALDESPQTSVTPESADTEKYSQYSHSRKERSRQMALPQKSETNKRAFSCGCVIC
ncbi:LANO_0H09648g1_1 [Lachancea nothofagi CBS 11611]|uniref:LANO_0H09648g1_1 n=1 Tax=Lachancea nothofagi CBS 11611 TaxID=1266666 RepID=A0A1G4KLT3_9SACH|nr:LANO_0H09648g1_1 [Lachancea nothofagi CBS 11611]